MKLEIPKDAISPSNLMNWSWYYISILVLTTATAFLGHEALEFASERLKAEVLNVETAMRDWTAMGLAVNC